MKEIDDILKAIFKDIVNWFDKHPKFSRILLYLVTLSPFVVGIYGIIDFFSRQDKTSILLITIPCFICSIIGLQIIIKDTEK